MSEKCFDRARRTWEWRTFFAAVNWVSCSKSFSMASTSFSFSEDMGIDQTLLGSPKTEWPLRSQSWFHIPRNQFSYLNKRAASLTSSAMQMLDICELIVIIHWVHGSIGRMANTETIPCKKSISLSTERSRLVVLNVKFLVFPL